MIYIAYISGDIVGAFVDKQLARKWAELSDVRDIRPVKDITPTFAAMTAQYNTSYEG